MRRVYFIKPIGMDGPIKIGCSASPERRRSSLETWSPFALEIVAEIEGDEKLERRFHAKFVHLHQRREWFHASPEIDEVIVAIRAGTFDVSTLPEGRRVDGLGKRLSETSRKQLSYSLRLSYMASRTGFRCRDRGYDIFKTNDLGRIAQLDAYLADPATHGEPINAPWAEKKRAAL